jgi:hypothetical protein
MCTEFVRSSQRNVEVYHYNLRYAYVNLTERAPFLRNSGLISAREVLHATTSHKLGQYSGRYVRTAHLADLLGLLPRHLRSSRAFRSLWSKRSASA